MKRVSHIFLLLGATFSLVQAMIGFALCFIIGFLFIGTGLGLDIASIIILLTGTFYDEIPSWIIAMLSSGIGCLVGGGVSTTIITIDSILYELTAVLAFANVFVLKDKKVGYIFSIIFAVLTMLNLSFWLGLIILLGGIFGLIALAKDKKKEKEALEMEEVK